MALSCLTDPHAHLQATLDEGILELVLNRPERKNALFSDFYLAIEQALLEAETDKSVRVVLLRGVADDFSAQTPNPKPQPINLFVGSIRLSIWKRNFWLAKRVDLFLSTKV